MKEFIEKFSPYHYLLLILLNSIVCIGLMLLFSKYTTSISESTIFAFIKSYLIITTVILSFGLMFIKKFK